MKHKMKSWIVSEVKNTLEMEAFVLYSQYVKKFWIVAIALESLKNSHLILPSIVIISQAVSTRWI
jgi:hypothetical protein